MTRAEADQAVTRQRLLEAAGQEFAERGFRNVTVRDICTRAEANVAAINYHFGDKEKLYAAAVHYAHLCATRHDVVGAVAAAKALSPEQRLHAFIRTFLTGILETGRPAWHAKLMAREIAEPTGVLNEIAQQTVRPRLQALSAIIRDIIGPRASQQTVINCARSVVGQILFYHFARPMLVRVFPNEPLDASRLDELASHITSFSLAGLRGIAADLKKLPKTKGKRARR
ncbi:MAG: TetR/AcrR family transcriptional regulator, regulator of cefoperazone and chloramphenicol [Phycisphaerales bacterium]|jgi:AcrR family transcriptional regulator|nr:TetR/AcrR family transcriptional regulator, regulator of cefoperazone and chloramphenicol [Phycisphaerales bacterium]MEA2736451.1 TetR/AcrR family transcriptional regulator, regulator of cefoperazone and chloramphenicol [Humisphaera sp.]